MHRPSGVLGAAVLAVALLAAACGDDPAPPVSGAPASEVCTDEERPRLQEGSHLLGDKAPPVPYSSIPPSSGWHRSGQPSLGVRDVALTDPELVSALEAGHVVVAYDPGRVSEVEVERLRELTTSTFADRLTVTPYDQAMATGLAYVGWGVIRRCEQLDEAALGAFVLTWFGQSSLDHGDAG